MTDLIVAAALIFAIVFFVAWLVRPGLRAWIERPKYRFLGNVQLYETRSAPQDGRSNSH